MTCSRVYPLVRNINHQNIRELTFRALAVRLDQTERIGLAICDKASSLSHQHSQGTNKWEEWTEVYPHAIRACGSWPKGVWRQKNV